MLLFKPSPSHSKRLSKTPVKDIRSHPKFLSRSRLSALVTVLLGCASLLRAGTFDPLVVTLQPTASIGTLPSWEGGSTNRPSIHSESDSLDLPVPSLISQEEIGCFALTVVFNDNGDGGPVVDWISNQGETTLLSAGLGDNGVAIGLNARTLLLPQSLTLDGGKIRVSFTGRFSRMISVTLRPARELGVAALGENFKAALITDPQHVLSQEEVSGADLHPETGDRTDGYVTHADLAALPVRLDVPGAGGVMEFVIPLADKPVGSQIQAEIGGLDPESWIEVTVNGESRGILAPAPFSLNDPSVIISSEGHLQVAGWRSASVYVPARLWTNGDNSLVLTLHRAAGDSETPVYLRKVTGDFLFSSPGSSPVSANSPMSNASANPTVDPLSNGSLYGNPSPSLFHASAPTPIPDPLSTKTTSQ